MLVGIRLVATMGGGMPLEGAMGGWCWDMAPVIVASVATVTTISVARWCSVLPMDGRGWKRGLGGIRCKVGHLLGEGGNLLCKSSKCLLSGFVVGIIGNLDIGELWLNIF